MGWWGEHALPRLTDVLLRGHEIGELRGEACAGLRGSVLEIGFGSGLNVRWYPPEVTEVHAVEPADTSWRLSARRRARTTLPIERTGLDGQRLDAADASYDSVLSTFTLCSIPDVAAGPDGGPPRAQARRRASTTVEHGLAPDARVATVAAPPRARRSAAWGAAAT